MPKTASSGKRDDEDVPRKLPPARTRERRTQQLVVMAEELVEERLRTGTASPTEVTAVLRLGAAAELANVERIKAQTAYLEAQRAKAESETFREQKYKEAMEAMARYAPP